MINLGLNHGLQSARALCLFGRDKPPIGSSAGWRSAALRLYHIQRPVVLRKKASQSCISLQPFRSGLENENAKKNRFAAKALQNLRTSLSMA